MSRPTPAVLRATAILDLLAANPGGLRLAEIVNRLDFSHASCHAVLAALVKVGYLYRTNDKVFELAPAFLKIATIAAESLSPLDVAAREMRALADEYDAICTAIFRAGWEMVVKETATSASHLRQAVLPGTRMPLRAPFGTVLLSWSSDDEIQHWLNQGAGPTDVGQMRASLIFAREHGFVGGFRKDLQTDHGELQPFEYPVKTQHIAQLDPKQRYAVAFLGAPVFDASGRVAFALNLTGMPIIATGERIEALGRRLRSVCDRISLATGGRIPT